MPKQVTFAACQVDDVAHARAVMPHIPRSPDVEVHDMPVEDGTVFRCVYAYQPPHPEVSRWLLIFYEHIAFYLIPMLDEVASPRQISALE